MKLIKLIGLIMLLMLTVTLIAGCSSSDETSDTDATPVQTEPDFIGNITDIQQIGNNEVVGTIQVEANVVTGDGSYIDKYVITVKDETLILQQEDAIVGHISFDELEIGQKAQVWFSGPVKESFPMQVDAQQVMVVDDKDDNGVDLGQEFSLSIGQSASMNDSDLGITLLEIVTDSRCPRDVVCIWVGEVVASVEITLGNSTEKVALTQPGSSSVNDTVTYDKYRIYFDVQPYPEEAQDISQEDYELVLTIVKLVEG